jgi:hypothetical protein
LRVGLFLSVIASPLVVERIGEKMENRPRVPRSYLYPTDADGGPPPDAQRPQERRW